MNFETISASLRIGFKYNLNDIRNEAINRIAASLPNDVTTYSSWGPLLDTAGVWPQRRLEGGTAIVSRHIHVHARDFIAIVNMAGTFGYASVVPFAFYMCAQLENDLLVRGYTDETGRRWNLSADDLIKCQKGQRRLSQAMMRNLRWMIEGPRPNCRQKEECSSAMRRNLESFWTELYSRYDALRPVSYFGNLFSGYCMTCVTWAREKHREELQVTWNELGTYFDIPQQPTVDSGMNHS